MVPAVYKNFSGRCCLFTEEDGRHAYFIQNDDEGLDLYCMPLESFKRTYAELPDYPVERAAQLYLNSSTIPTPRAQEILLALLPQKEPVMATKNKKASPKKTAPAPKKAPAKKVDAAPAPAPAPKNAPGAVIGEVVNAGKTTATVAPTKAPEKASAKTAPKKEVAGGQRGRRGVFSDPDSTVSLVKNPTDKIKKRAQMIVDLLTANGKKMTAGALLKGVTKNLEAAGQNDPPNAVLNVHGGFLVNEGYVTVK